MANNNERLEKALDDVLKGLQMITKAAEKLKEALTDATPAEESPDPEKTYTFQEIRGIMASLSGSGKKAEAKALLGKYGASRLSEVAESDYAALAKDAEVIADE